MLSCSSRLSLLLLLFRSSRLPVRIAAVAIIACTVVAAAVSMNSFYLSSLPFTPYVLPLNADDPVRVVLFKRVC